jgi:hypothetical protein
MVAVRAGFAYLSFSATATDGSQSTSASTTYVWIPITASYVGLRSGKHALEVGAGVTFLDASGAASGAGASVSGSGIAPRGTAMIGYRLQPVDHAGVQFRIGFIAHYGNGAALQDPDPTKFGIQPWAYLSLGASF